MNTKISKDLGDILQKASTRQVGDTKTDKNGQSLIWTKLKSGKEDWRVNKTGTSAKKTTDAKPAGTMTAQEKMLAHLKKSPSADLRTFANKPKNAPKLRQAAYDELVERGEDVDDIDLNTGIYGQMKQAFGGGTPNTAPVDSDDDEEEDIIDFGDDSEEDEDDDYQDPDFIKNKFGNLRTKKQRIAYDDFVHSKKIANPSYKTPDIQIQMLNRLYGQVFSSDAPLMIASGGAGVGKTYNFHLVAKVLNKKPFDPEHDQPGDADYDYVEAPEVDSPVQLMAVLKEHNGKIILFDDSDNVLKKTETAGILKKATAGSGKRIIGKKSTGSGNVDPFEFTGQIVFLTNMNQAQLNRDPNAVAIMSRAIKNDIYFTKKEQLFFVDKFKHSFEFTGIKRLSNKADDIQEKEDVFKIMKDNLTQIDPLKFNVRSMQEMLNVKRGDDVAAGVIANDPVAGKMVFGDVGDWKENVKDFLIKGADWKKERNIEKAKNILNL